MAKNMLGIKIDFKCDICGTREAIKYYRNKEKGSGFVCVKCHIEAVRTRKRMTPRVKMNRADAIERVLKFVVESQISNPGEIITPHIISKQINLNYATVLKSLQSIQDMQQFFFSKYDINIQRLRSNGHPTRSGMLLISCKSRKDEQQ